MIFVRTKGETMKPEKKGMRASEAAEYCKKSVNTIHRWHNDKGLKGIPKTDPVEFKKEVVDAFILTVARSGRKLKNAKTETMKELYEAGKTAQFIGDKFKMTKVGVLRRLRKAGVKIRKVGTVVK